MVFLRAFRLKFLLAALPVLLFAHGGGVGAFADTAGVASAHPLATEAGVEMLRRGGNAFDAAVAVSAALAVVEPAGSGLGGGGFWLLHDAAAGRDVMLDGREKAPLAATRDMFLDADGEVIPRLSIDGALAAGIPGAPAALAYLAKNYGALPLAVTLAPAIRLAREGFEVGPRHRWLAKFRRDALAAFPAAAAIFLVDGEPPPENARLVQRDLATTLEALAAGGRDGFYHGEVARKLVDGVRAAGGIWTLQDLRAYRVEVREPVVVHYKGMKVVSAALPSSGGLVLGQALNILAGYDMEALNAEGGEYAPDFVHFATEAMRRAYRDRARYMGDGDFVEVPVDKLVHPHYAAGQRQSIRRERATPSDWLSPLDGKDASSSGQGEGADTTHFSIIDAAGNRVAATLSVNYGFGAALVPPGTGVLLNDEMDDFSIKPGAPNIYGLVGAEANAIAGGKRMLSSMTPTFLEAGAGAGGRVAVLGAPGGSRIISMALLAALDFYNGAGAKEMVARPRFHHQYLPDAIQYEPDALPAGTRAILLARGHALKKAGRAWGNMQVVIRDGAKVSAASDPRGEGAAVTVTVE